jgi:hypothetical protein
MSKIGQPTFESGGKGGGGLEIRNLLSGRGQDGIAMVLLLVTTIYHFMYHARGVAIMQMSFCIFMINVSHAGTNVK